MNPGVVDNVLVSVIMNAHNAEQYLHQAIDSVLAQSYEKWEIILWDNNSTDTTGNIVRSYSDARIKYYYSDQFMPLGQARNFAIQKAKGEFIAFLDCDDIWYPKKLEKQLPLFADTEVGLVYSDSIFFNQDDQESRAYSKHKPYRGNCFRELLTDYILSMETVIVRKTTLESMDHWFDERFNAIEEYELFVRIGEQWKIDYIFQPLSKWRVHSESWTWRKQHTFIEEKKKMLRKLKCRVGITQRYPGLLNEVEVLFALDEAKHLWAKGAGNEARNLLISLRKWSLKGFTLWFMSFFPFYLVDAIYSRLTGTIRPK